MSATSNLVSNLEHRLSYLRGEREAAVAEVRSIEEKVTQLSSLHEQIASLDKAIEAAETLLRHDRPDWQSSRVKPVVPRVWKSPFKPGDIGRTALTVLREDGGWLRPRDVAKRMLIEIGQDPDDRAASERLTNSVGNYFTTHKGDLVESRGSFAKEWRVIRDADGYSENVKS